MIDIDNVVDFCFEELNIDNENIDVNVYLDNLFEEEGVKGWCHDAIVDEERELYEYEIELDENLDDDELLITLCHEMVHVKQYSEERDADEDEAYELEGVLADAFKNKKEKEYKSPVPCFGLAGL